MHACIYKTVRFISYHFTYSDSGHYNLYAMRAHLPTLFIALVAAMSEYSYLHPQSWTEQKGTNGLIHPVYWWQFQVRAKFRSGHIFNYTVQPLSAYKSNGEKTKWQPPIFVSCLLNGTNGFIPLFRSNSMHLPLREVETKIAKDKYFTLFYGLWQ